MPTTLTFAAAVPTLYGDLVTLRELAEDDIPAWFARATDAESADLAGDPIPESIEEGAGWLQVHRDRFREQTGIRWAIVPNGPTQSVGTIGLTITLEEERRADLGYVIGRAHWGQGICTAAARLVTAYAFEHLGLAEVRAELLQRNVASRRVLEKTGFRFQQALQVEDPPGSPPEDCYVYLLSAAPVAAAE